MGALPVMLYFNGKWDSSNSHSHYDTDAVVVSTESTYETLVSVVATQLSIDTSVKRISIKRKITDWSAPMEIRNDMGVQVYVEMKKDK